MFSGLGYETIILWNQGIDNTLQVSSKHVPILNFAKKNGLRLIYENNLNHIICITQETLYINVIIFSVMTVDMSYFLHFALYYKKNEYEIFENLF